MLNKPASQDTDTKENIKISRKKLLLSMGAAGVAMASGNILNGGGEVAHAMGTDNFNVQASGAKGDGTTDDASAIQTTISQAVAAGGGTIFFPQGTYKIGSTLLQDFCIKMRDGSSPRAFCLRAGDAKDYLTAERLWLEGANALALKISTTATYAQMNTVFRQCTFYSNYASRWFADDATADVYAVYSESDGAYWDNVRFEACEFSGLVETRAHLATFENCMFSVNPKRPNRFANNLEVRIGNATVNNCYFEDHATAIVISPTIGPIHTVSILDSHFSGTSNYSGTTCQNAITISDDTGQLAAVDIIRCEFGDTLYANPSIYNNGGANVRIENAVNIFDTSKPVRITHLQPNFSVFLPNDQHAAHTERIRMKGKTDSTAFPVQFARIDGFANLTTYLMSRPCWISKLTVMLDKKLPAGSNLEIRVLQNGTIITKTPYPGKAPTQYSINADADAEMGYLINPPTPIFKTGEKMTVQVVVDATAPADVPFYVEVELAY